MASIEQKVTSAILTVIRARREPGDDLSARATGSTARASLREAQFSDFNAVVKLKLRGGLSSDSLENWERLWHRNPALGLRERPIGWVLEAEGQIVGYMGNITQLYRYGDRTLTAVTSHGLVVEPAYRPASLSLVAAFYHQKFADLYLTTTAIEAVGKIARMFKSDPLPQLDYETVLFWVLQPRPFAEGLMKKLAIGPAFSQMGGVFASLAIQADGFFRRRKLGAGSPGLTVSESGVNEIGDEFQKLWEQKVSEQSRLLADRSPASLRWHFQIPGDLGASRVLCCRKGGELLGYAVVRNEPPNKTTGLRRSLVADMLVKQDDPEVLMALWGAAYDQAKRAGSHVLEVLGFPENLRKLCLQSHPYQRRYPACPFFYKASDPTLHRLLLDGRLWYASPFDGDTTLFSYGSAA